MDQWNPFYKSPAISLLGVVIVILPFLLHLRDLRVRSDTDTLLESNPSQKATLEKVTSVLQDQVIVVVDVEVADVFSADGLASVARVSDALLDVDGVADVKSLTHSVKPVRQGFSFDMVPLAPANETDPEALEKLRSFCVDNPLIRNVMVSPDSRHATLTLTFGSQFDTWDSKRALRENLAASLAPFQEEGLVFKVIGLPLVEEEVYTTIRQDFARFIPLVAGFLLITLGLAFRSVWFVGFMLVNQLLALGLIAGTLQAFGYPFTVFTLLLFPLWAGVHLTLLVHLGAACQRVTGISGKAVVGEAVRQVFKSCGFATLTTLAGLLALGLAPIPQVREAGLIGAYGVALVFLMTFGPGVALFAVYYQRKTARQNEAADSPEAVASGGAAESWLRFLQRGRPLVAVGTLAALVAIVFWGGKIRTGVRPIEFLPVDSPSRAAGELFNESYGGFNVFQLQVDSGAANGVNRLPFLRYLEDVQKFAESKEGVSGAYSYAQVLAMMNQIWEQEKPGSLALPENPLLLGTFSLVLKAQKFPFFEALCDPDFRTANLAIRSPDQPSDEYLAVLDEILNYAEANKPEGVTLSAEQGLHTILEADQQLVSSQVRSAGTALLVVLVLLMFLWRSWKLACLAVFVNALPVGMVLVVASFLDVPLNAVTVMIGAVAFGIAIDDTVHLVTQWLAVRSEKGGDRAAMVRAIQIKFWPLVCTSLVLGGIFALLALNSFPPVQHFGGLSALAFGLALLSVFGLLPAALVSRRS